MLTEHLRSSIFEIDASWQIVEKGYCLPWGGTRGDETITSTDYGYTGQKQEGDIYYYGARWPKVPEAKLKGFDPSIGRFMQADTIVPLQVQGTQAFDRYAYVNNNPMKFIDPKGHSANWFGDFLSGFGAEMYRLNSWVGLILTPNEASFGSISPNESDSMSFGRIAADITSVAIGIAEINIGITISGGGAVLGCGTTMCVAAVPAVGVGEAVVVLGGVTVLSGVAGLGENIYQFARRSRNDLKPDSRATGPHSTAKRDPSTGKVTNYETYTPQTNPLDPNPWSKLLRYDATGRPHPETGTGIDILPHVHDFIKRITRRPYKIEMPK